MTAQINHPDHYNTTELEAIDVMEAWFDSDPWLFMALKYIARAGHKAGQHEADDLRKCAWYLRRRLHKGPAIVQGAPTYPTFAQLHPVRVAMTWGHEQGDVMFDIIVRLGTLGGRAALAGLCETVEQYMEVCDDR